MPVYRVTPISNPDGGSFKKDVVEAYEQGKHRRYGLLFAVNGGAFAIGKLLVGTAEAKGVVLGGMSLQHLSLGMALFTVIMTFDIWKFGERMRKLDGELFGWPGKGVLLLLCALLVAGWYTVGFVSAPDAVSLGGK